MKINKQQFKFFIKECKHWIDECKIDDTRIAYMLCEPDMDGDASTTQYFADKYAEIKLQPELEPHDGENINEMLQRLAKHEVMHILTGEMMLVAMSRFTNEEEIRSCSHRLVRKLEQIIC